MSPYPKWRSSSISGSCLRVRGQWSCRLAGELVQLERFALPHHCNKKRAEQKGEAFSLLLNLRFFPHLWSWRVGHDQKNKITDFKWLIWICSEGWLASPLGVRLEVHLEELGVEPLLSCIERCRLRWFGHVVRMPPVRLPREVFQARPARKAPGQNQIQVERLYLCTGLGMPWDHQSDLADVAREREVWGPLLKLTRPWIRAWRWMGGTMLGLYYFIF